MRQEQSALKKLISARSSLVMNQAFFGTLAMRMKWREDPLAKKLWTDSVHIGFNPEWVKTASHDELQARICEIVMHNAHGHAWRRDGRNPKEWNIATDRSLWNVLKQAGFALPDDVYYESGDLGQSAEKIYSRIHKPPPPPQPNPKPGSQPGQSGGAPGQQPGKGKGKPEPQKQPPPQGGDKKPGSGQGQQPQQPDPEPEEQDDDPGSAGEVRDAPLEQEAQLRGEWQVAVLQAAQAAKQRGQLPGGLEEMLERITHPSVDWRAALRKFIQQASKNDYTWAKPNRRYLGLGFYMPAIHSEELPPIVVGIDTSSSISKEELDAFASELTGIMRECRPEKTYIAYCNVNVHKSEEFEPDEDIKFGRLERGGTDMPGIFRWIAKEEIEPACTIIFTDMETGFGEAPDYPVLWCTKSRIEAPHGETLRIQED